MRLWIKSYQATDRDPQTRKFCRLTGLDTPAAVGSLHMIWWWAMDWAPEGDLTKFEPIDLADAAHFEGDAQVFFDALVEAGYVAKTLEGHEIMDWNSIGGQVIEGRKKAATKKANQRAKAAEKKAAEEAAANDVPGDIPKTSPSSLPTVPVQEELDKELDIDKEKDLKINGHAGQNPNQEPNQNQKQEPKPEQTAGKSATPNEQPKTEEKGGRKKPVYEEGSPFLNMATYLKAKIDEVSAAEGVNLAPRANLQSWANELRLMEEVQEYTDRSLTRELMDWLPNSGFWRKNVLSAATFREKYPTLVLDMREAKKKAAAGNKGSGGGRGGRGYGHQKQEIPIGQDDGSSGAVSAEEHAALMRKAAEIKASKQGATGR
ncbi:hypothetical protein A8L34_22380 [Bacillus sp. FJAT-27264]|uniref:hypothetical protein n=1 Tax=Paenibacillus sp. (strain DSM 101736 / FJAT-27264) TaxID=1850362 RepID=UPI000807D5EB|nr:hypothetical protein [Bacillus sp. FJAT-27264]OBZ08903.1 hypothetical protein A8L34_22380 [Bacillus sp. FJAT-27264]